MDCCGKSSGLADFENTVARGSAIIFDTDSGLCGCLMFGSWVLNEIWIIDLSSSLVSMLMSLSKLFLFSNEAHLTVTVFVTALCFSHHTCCLLYIWAKLTLAFTFTSFPCNLYTCVIGLEKKFWRIDGFGEKKAQIGGLAHPYSPPSGSNLVMSF